LPVADNYLAISGDTKEWGDGPVDSGDYGVVKNRN